MQVLGEVLVALDELAHVTWLSPHAGAGGGAGGAGRTLQAEHARANQALPHAGMALVLTL